MPRQEALMAHVNEKPMGLANLKKRHGMSHSNKIEAVSIPIKEGPSDK
jgi:hypothetical protein